MGTKRYVWAALQCAAALCSWMAPVSGSAQNAVWTYSLGGTLVDASPYSFTNSGDLLVHSSRFGGDGTALWRRSYNSPGALVEFGMASLVEHGSGFLGLCSFIYNTEYRVALVHMDGSGAPTSATRLLDPSVLESSIGPFEKVVSAPDGGCIVVKGNVYRFHADGSLWWAKEYGENEKPQFFAWAADGGFYGLANGAGIIRYTAEGEPVRVMTTLSDQYAGNLAITVIHPMLLHEDRLYVGIGPFMLQDGMFRSNTGVMVMDTIGTILGQLMNDELLSPVDDNCVGSLVTLAIVGGRLQAAMSQTSTNVGGRSYLLDCALDLSDGHWYALPEGADYFAAGMFAAPDGRAVLAGEYDGDLMHARYFPGTDLSGCYTALPYTEAPLVLGALQTAPDPTIAHVLAPEPITMTSSLDELPTRTEQCSFNGISTQRIEELRVYPNPANDRLTVEGEYLHPGATLVVRDAQGRQLVRQRSTGLRQELLLGELTTGLYSITLEEGVGRTRSRLFSVAR